MKKNLKTPFLVTALLCVATSQIRSQQNNTFDGILGRLYSYVSKEAPEKLYLHTDKEFYTKGETIWFKSYLVNGITHTRTYKSNVVYVELLDSLGRVVEERSLYADSLGVAGDIKIKENLPQGHYLLRSFTNYMLNNEDPVFFQKEILVRSPKIPLAQQVQYKTLPPDNLLEKSIADKPMVTFYPEGGNLVTGLFNTVGFKITDQRGNGIIVKGEIRNTENLKVADFHSSDFGLGTFGFTPEPHMGYYAVISVDGQEERVALPKPLLSGYILNVKNMGDYVLLKVSSNTEMGLEGTLLMGHIRGNLFFKHIGKPNEKEHYSIKLLTNGLDDGVAQFTLFTNRGEPVCERLVFMDHPNNDVTLSIASPKEVYAQREKVVLNLKLTDTGEEPLSGNLSMSVVTDYHHKVNDALAPDIKSWLLLDSDLGATVENAAYFFKDNSLQRHDLLDALMITHGWRRFVWKEFLQRTGNKKVAFLPEKGIMITGKTTAFDNKYRTRPAMVTLGIFDQGIYQEKKHTDKQGNFSFGPFTFQDSINVVLDAIDPNAPKKGKEKDIAIHVDAPELKVVPKGRQKTNSFQRTLTYVQEHMGVLDDGQFYTLVNDSTIIELDEVVVNENKKTRAEIVEEEINALTLHGKARNRMFIDSFPGNEQASVMDILRMFPSVSVEGRFPNQIVKVRGGLNSINLSTEPLYLLDGVQVPIDVIQGMNAFGVLFIDVLTGAEASFYGVRGANGVIAVYTDRGLRFSFEQKRYPGITNFTLQGFYKTREFHSPNYGRAKPKHKMPDYRTTLFWNPNILMDAKSPTPISFYTGDRTGSFWVKIEGITKDGRPFKTDYRFEVE